ncbi:MAG TPA: PEGA domain-containing protein [Blastocatellia bacterium]
MKALRRIFVTMMALSILTYGQGNNFNKIRYNGGTVETKTKPDDWGNSLSVSSEEIRLELKDGQKIVIDPKRVTGLGYGQEAHRRVGTMVALAFLSPVALFGLFHKTRLHYISVEFTTPEEKKSALLIQAHKDNYRAVLTALRGATGAPVAVSEEDRKFVPVGIETVTAKKEGEEKKPEGAAVAAAEGATGAVRIASQPEGADIWVDNAFVGNAPAQLKLAPGKHRIKVGKEGFKNWEKEITVMAGSELTINAPLKK